MILLDSNTIIYLSKKLIKIDDILEDNTIPLVSVVTYMEVLDSIVGFVKKNLLDSLNFCSHENVSKKFDKNLIDNIYNNMNEVLNMSNEYFK